MITSVLVFTHSFENITYDDTLLIKLFLIEFRDIKAEAVKSVGQNYWKYKWKQIQKHVNFPRQQSGRMIKFWSVLDLVRIWLVKRVARVFQTIRGT